MRVFIIAVGGLVASALAACQTFDDRPFYDPLNLQVELQPRQPKQVQVAPTEASFALQFDRGDSTVGESERRAVADFLRRRAGAVSDEVFVDTGVLGADPVLDQDRHMTVAEIVTAAGLDPTQVRVRENVAGVGPDEVSLTVRRYLVTLPGCPDFTTRPGWSFDNRPHANWGCATASNFGLMLAEPRDVLQGRGATPGDGEALSLGIQRYRTGQTYPLAVDDTNTADSHGVQGESGGSGGGGQ